MDPQARHERLKRARKHAKLSLRKVAQRFSIDPSTVHRWELVGEHGTAPTADRLEELAALYGVTPSWLAFGEGEGPIDDAEADPDAFEGEDTQLRAVEGSKRESVA